MLGNAFGRGDIGWHGFRAGRKLGADDLQLLILALLDEGPAHGYELIKVFGERSGGFYNPSPGMVYPALTYLEEIGYASVEADGNRKLYRITEAGRAWLDENRSVVDTIFEQLKWAGEKMAHMRRAFSDETERADGTSARLREARSRLRSVLVERGGASDEEQRRIADILDRATEEIRGK